jgi:hypothetical protein
VIQAVHVDIDTIGMTARRVKSVDSTGLAELVNCHTCVEAIFLNVCGARNQLKPIFGNNQM